MAPTLANRVWVRPPLGAPVIYDGQMKCVISRTLGHVETI